MKKSALGRGSTAAVCPRGSLLATVVARLSHLRAKNQVAGRSLIPLSRTPGTILLGPARESELIAAAERVLAGVAS